MQFPTGSTHLLFLSSLLLACAAGPSEAQTPDWSIDPSAFQSTMTLTAAVYVDGARSSGEDDLLGAFVGEEVRGVAATTEVAGSKAFFLTAYANMSGETMTFKFFESVRGRVLPIEEALAFSANGSTGTPSSPVVLTTDTGSSSCPVGDPAWSVNPSAFESTMSITGAPFVFGERASHPDDRVAAFIGDEIRGVASPVDVSGESVFFLTAHANADGQTVRFKMYDAVADIVRSIEETLVFEANAVVGFPTEPLAWTTTCDTATGIDDEPASHVQGNFSLVAFPNPFQSATTIRYILARPAVVTLTVVDLLGRPVRRLVSGMQAAGDHEVGFEAYGLSAGVYVSRVETAAYTETQTLVLVK